MYDIILSVVPSGLQLYFPFVMFAIALAALVKTADWFVEAAERLGLTLGVPHFIIGITIIGIGTSLPELATTIVTIFESTPENDLTEIISANIIGSNIANILLGVGIASLFWTVKVDRNLQDNDLPFLFGSTAIAILFMADFVITGLEGLILLIMFFTFLLFSVFDKTQQSSIKKAEKVQRRKKGEIPLLLLLLFFSGAGIVFSSGLTIDSLIDASPILGIEKDVASMVLLAVGTSFPEIFVSVMAVKKGNTSLAVGNILGSNIGNALGILGVAGILADITVSEKSVWVGLPFMGIATLFFIISALDNRFRIWEGVMAVAIFLSFLGQLFDVL
jgi:cation:H+ antiporter